MALNLSGTINGFTEFFTGVGQTLGLIPVNTTPLYPTSGTLRNVQSSLNEKAWNMLPFPYTFAVYSNEGRVQATGDFEAFSLPIPPSDLTQDEPYSISIKKTQGGSVVNHSGAKYKKLILSGTTGIAPLRGGAGVNAQDGTVIAKPKELKYKSGHAVFIELRNWFRTYYQLKATDKSPVIQDYRLVFQNYKDGEFLIVELTNFKLKKSADRTFLYDYELTFEVLGQFNFEPPLGNGGIIQDIEEIYDNVVSSIDTARGIFLQSQQLLRSIESFVDGAVFEPLRKVSLAVKAAAGIVVTAGDVGNRIVKNTVTAGDSLNILKTFKAQLDANKNGTDTNIPDSFRRAKLPSDLNAATASRGADTVIDLNDALLDMEADQLPEATQIALEQEIEDVTNLQKSFYQNTVDTLKRVKANAEDAFNLGSSEYDSIFDRTTTLGADSTKEVTLQEFEVLQAFNQSITAINTIISLDAFFKSELQDRFTSIEQAFNNEIELSALPAVKTIILEGGVDLEDIALRELRDPTRWIEIAELNDLKAPYIVQDLSDTRSNVKKPGDIILIPKNITDGFPDVDTGTTNKLTAPLDEFERSLGVDFKLDDNFDLILGNNGDLELIAGLQNMAQAVVLKFGYEKGELRNHPTLGAGLQIGSKFVSLEIIRDNVISTLSQDQRISTISNVALLRENSSLSLSFEIQLKNVDKPIPLKVNL